MLGAALRSLGGGGRRKQVLLPLARGLASKRDARGDLLRAVCNAREVDHYLDMFQAGSKGPAFAVVKVGGDVVEYDLDVLTETCATLHGLGLLPIVIHGGGPQMNDELARQGVEPRYIRGSRVTDQATLDIARRIFTELNERVVTAFRGAGVGARALPEGVFKAEVAQPELGFVGEVRDMDAAPILASLKANEVPVLTSLGSAASGQVLNINADVAARDLVMRLRPMRVLFASAKGGWVDEETGRIASVVDLANQYDELASLDYEGRQGTLLKLNEIKQILDNTPQHTTVAITSAGTMLRELFTHEGAGTLFRKGEPVTRLAEGAVTSYTYGAADSSPVRATVNAASKLGGVPPVLEAFSRDPEVPAGLGHADAVWRALRRDHPSLAWAWGPGSPADSVLPEAVPHADSVMRAGDTSVAFYNRGHALQGWSAETAGRLLAASVPPRVAAAAVGGAKPAAAEGQRMYKVGLLGARGYVGREFVKLLAGHGQMQLTVASSRALAGQRVSDCFGLGPSAGAGVARDLCFEALEPEDLLASPEAREVDVWVLALPNGLAPRFVAPLEKLNPEAVMIDLGADYRFTDDWTYGLPERPGARDKLRGAKRIANPGCYATGVQAGLMPLLQPLPGSRLEGLADLAQAPVAFGVSGYSGAGTNPSDKNDPRVLADNLLPYTLVNHMHERECTRHLQHPVGFMPHVASWFQGIHVTLSVQLHAGAAVDEAALLEEYQRYYADEPLVKVTAEAPVVRDNMFKHHVAVGGFALHAASGRLALAATIDNLLKGAATQAVQNLNVSLGMDEFRGIDYM